MKFLENMAWFMIGKSPNKAIAIFIALILIISAAVPIYAENANATIKNKTLSSKIAKLPDSEKSIIYQNINVLSDAGFNTMDISDIKKDNGNIQFIIDFEEEKNLIEITNHTPSYTEFKVSDNENENFCKVYSDGRKFLDGFEIKGATYFENTSIQSLLQGDDISSFKGKSWKSVRKSFSPPKGKSSSDYNELLSKGYQNVELGKTMDKVTVAALWWCLESMIPYKRIRYAGKAVKFTRKILKYFKTKDPKSKAISSYFKTYISGPFEYEYITKVYSRKNNKGAKRNSKTYETFRVY